jgi:hypothetical protein
MINEEFLNYLLIYIFIALSFLLIIAMINVFSAHDEPINILFCNLEDLKTGDILGVAYNNMAGNFTSAFSKSIWTHTGTVWVDPKTHITYILEAAVYPDKNYQHIVQIPFDVWYSYNNKFIIGIVQYQGPKIDEEKMLQEFLIYRQAGVKLEGLNHTWGRFLFNRRYFKSKINKRYTCYELTILLHQNCNIYKKEKLHTSYFPGHIMNNRISCENGISYTPVKRFFMVPLYTNIIRKEKMLHHQRIRQKKEVRKSSKKFSV